MFCGWSLLSLTRHLFPALHPGMLDVCVLSSDGTGSYMYISILHIHSSVLAFAQLAGMTWPPVGTRPCALI